MNTSSNIEAAKKIEELSAALDWLKEHGKSLRALNRDIKVYIECVTASACYGHKQALAAVADQLRLNLDEAVAATIRDCKNTIERQRAALARKATKGGAA